MPHKPRLHTDYNPGRASTLGAIAELKGELKNNSEMYRDVPVDGGPPVRDGGERRDGTLLQLPEPQRCTG